MKAILKLTIATALAGSAFILAQTKAQDPVYLDLTRLHQGDVRQKTAVLKKAKGSCPKSCWGCHVGLLFCPD